MNFVFALNVLFFSLFVFSVLSVLSVVKVFFGLYVSPFLKEGDKDQRKRSPQRAQRTRRKEKQGDSWLEEKQEFGFFTECLVSLSFFLCALRALCGESLFWFVCFPIYEERNQRKISPQRAQRTRRKEKQRDDPWWKKSRGLVFCTECFVFLCFLCSLRGEIFHHEEHEGSKNSNLHVLHALHGVLIRRIQRSPIW